MDEFEFKNRFLKFYLRGRKEPLIFHVSEVEYKRAVGACELKATEPIHQFFTFSTVRGESVAVAMAEIDLMQVLWEPVEGRASEDAGDDEISIGITLLYFREREEPLEALFDEQSAEEFFVLLDGGPSPHNTTLEPFADHDDEDLYLNRTRLQLAISGS